MTTTATLTRHARERWEERFSALPLSADDALQLAKQYDGWRNDTRFVIYMTERYSSAATVLIYQAVAFVIRNNRVVTVINSSKITRPTPPLVRPDLTPAEPGMPAHRKRRRMRSNRIKGALRERAQKQLAERFY